MTSPPRSGSNSEEPGRKKSGSKGAAKGAAAGSKAAKPRAAESSKAAPSRAAAPQRQPAHARPEPASAFGRVLRRHWSDLWGVFFVAAGLVCALAMYFGAAGPMGRALSAGFGSLFGVVRYLMPFAFVGFGIALIRGRIPATLASLTHDDGSHENEEWDDDHRSDTDALRLVLGFSLLAIAGTGLLHLFRGRPSWGDAADTFRSAGGWLGWLSGGPLHAGLGQLAGVLVLLAVLVAGAVLITEVSIRRWFAGSAAVANPLAGALRWSWRSLVGPEADERTAESMPPEVVVAGRRSSESFELEDDAGDDESTRRKSRGRRAAAGTPSLLSGPALDPTHDGSSGDPLIEDKERSLPPIIDVPVVEPDPEPAAKPAAAAPKAVVVQPPKTSSRADKSSTDLMRRKKGSKWKLPRLTLLETGNAADVDTTLVEEAGITLENALAAHGVETRLVGMVVGPTVTRYELELGEGVKVSRVTNLSKDIAYAMASADVRILAPIPGRQAIGVEVPNKQRQIVHLGDMLRSPEARKKNEPLSVPLGRDINGAAKMMNLAKMPHVLIAGATGSGKSSSINTIITSVLMRATPDEVRMILVDPKMVEMTQYERVPHLLTQPVTDPKKAANALAWACREMDRRYELLSSVGYRDIGGYNKAFDNGDLPQTDTEDPNAKQYPRLPLILVVVDELADLMMVAARDVEDSILRIAQKARAIGIHLVIATQRPSTNVITGVIKANIPAKIAFSVSNMTDSRVILDQPGAERLIGQGDMLMLSPTSSAADRIQGCWVTEEEVKKVVGAWREQEAEPVVSAGADAAITSETIAPASGPLDGVQQSLPGTDTVGVATGGVAAPAAAPAPAGDGFDAITAPAASIAGASESDDEMLPQAIELVVTSQLGSTSMLQRKLRVGFARAGRIMDELEEKGIVGPSVGSKAREVLITPEQLPSILG